MIYNKHLIPLYDTYAIIGLYLLAYLYYNIIQINTFHDLFQF